MAIAVIATDCFVYLQEGSTFADGTESSHYSCDTNNNVTPIVWGDGTQIGPTCLRKEVEPNDVPETCMDSSTQTGYNCVPNTETEYEKQQFGVPTKCPQPDSSQGLDPFGCIDWSDSGDQGEPITIEMDSIEDCNDEFYQH